MKVISFSLWGDSPKYNVGAIKNAKLALACYNDWNCFFYCDSDSVPENTLRSLSEFKNSKVILLSSSKEAHHPMFWRFYAAAIQDCSHAIFRDTDSRLTQRESMAVQAWISSGKSFHVMRDHPLHGVPVCAGMWGVVSHKLRDIRQRISDYYHEGLDTTKKFGGLDQDFLARKIWNWAKEDCFQHDEFFSNSPFPLPRDPKHFVGQVYDESDKPQY